MEVVNYFVWGSCPKKALSPAHTFHARGRQFHCSKETVLPWAVQVIREAFFSIFCCFSFCIFFTFCISLILEFEKTIFNWSPQKVHFSKPILTDIALCSFITTACKFPCFIPFYLDGSDPDPHLQPKNTQHKSEGGTNVTYSCYCSIPIAFQLCGVIICHAFWGPFEPSSGGNFRMQAQWYSDMKVIILNNFAATPHQSR